MVGGLVVELIKGLTDWTCLGHCEDEDCWGLKVEAELLPARLED